MLTLTDERIDWLTNQYILAIESDGPWDAKAELCANQKNFGQFRLLCQEYITPLRTKLRQEFGVELGNLTSGEYAFVVYTLWRNKGGGIQAVLQSPGKLEANYRMLIDRDDHLQAETKRKAQQFAELLENTVPAMDNHFEDALRYAMGAYQIAVDPAMGPDSTAITTKSINKFDYYIKKETDTMNTNQAPAIEIRTLVFGKDVRIMTEAELITAIKHIECQIADLKTIKSKSKKITTKIAEMTANLATIVSVLDAE